jgi:hypothetical protein
MGVIRSLLGLAVVATAASFATYYSLNCGDSCNLLTEAISEVAEAPSVLADSVDAEPPLTADVADYIDGFNQPGWYINPDHDNSGKFLLLSKLDIESDQPTTELIDLEDGRVVRRWSVDVESLKAEAEDSRTAAFRIFHPLLTEFGDLVFKNHTSPLYAIDPCGGLVWSNDDYRFHHSTEISLDRIFVPVKDASEDNVYEDEWDKLRTKNSRDDGWAEISLDGEIIAIHSLYDIMKSNGIDFLAFGLGTDRNDDNYHLNDVEVMDKDGEFYRAGDVFLSLRTPSLVMQYRPATERVLWYSVGPWSQQHDVSVYGDEITVFDNNVSITGKGRISLGNRLFRVKPAGLNQTEILGVYDLRDSNTESSGRANLTPDGIFVEDTNGGRVYEMTTDGEVLWQYLNYDPETGKSGRLAWSSLVTDLPKPTLERLNSAECPLPS